MKENIECIEGIKFLDGYMSDRTKPILVDILTMFPAIVRFQSLSDDGYNALIHCREQLEKGSTNGLGQRGTETIRDAWRRSSLVVTEWPDGCTDYDSARSYISQQLTDLGFENVVYRLVCHNPA